MFFAFADPILRMPTLLYFAGVPADLTPAMRWKVSRAEAAGASTVNRAMVAMAIFRVIGVPLSHARARARTRLA